MKYNTIIGLILFLILWFLSRFISDQGIKFLKDKEKSNLVTVLSKYKMINMIIPILILFIFFAFIIFNSQINKQYVLILALSLFFLYMLVVNLIIYFQLKKNNLPKKYLNYFLVGRTIAQLSIIALAGAMILPI